METTTQQRLMWQFVSAIQEIVPSYQHVNLEHDDELEESPYLQDARWTYVEAGFNKGRAERIPGKAVRTFTLHWGVGQPAYPGATRTGFFGGGETFAARLTVATSYAGVGPQDIHSLITQDAIDLRDTLADLLDPTVPGLAACEYIGVGNLSVDDNSTVYAEHYFDITWHAATTT